MRPILIDAGTVGAKAKFTLGSLRMNEIPTGVIYGFLKEIQDVFSAFGSNDIMFFWDSKTAEGFRRKLYPSYKVKRQDTRTHREKQEWSIAYEQYELLRTEILPKIGFENQFYVDGYEADDLLHQAATQLAGDNPIMLTNDEDMYQSLGYCDILKTKSKGILFTEELFLAKYGISSTQWAEVKSIAGCKSDEVEGIAGVGEKTAIKYLLGELKRTNKTYNSIVSPAGQETIARNKPLVTLPFKGVPELEFFHNRFNLRAFTELCEELGMVSLLGTYSYPVWERMLR